MIEHLTFSDGPKRVGPFSHAVKSDEYLFVTGQMPTLENDPSKLVSNDIRDQTCLLYTSPSPRDPNRSRMPSSA